MKRKAVVLLSGGLDSMLAAKVMLEQNIDVIGLNFFTGFCHSGHTSTIRNQKPGKVMRNDALWVAETLGIKLCIEDIVEPYKEIVINPQFGYGQHVNPCLDCKVFMVNKALEWMTANGYDFLVTGEVIGQRPKSQRKETMPIVEERSGAMDLLLRPLCAKLLPETKPERLGWVDREKLYAFSGRGRKPQMALASCFGIDSYAQPAGGCCVLTDGNYASRLEDMWAHRGTKSYELDDVVLLKAGRHLRLSEQYKLIIGRDESENQFLSGYKKQHDYFYCEGVPGPLVLVDGSLAVDELEHAARIVARFSKARESEEVTVHYVRQGESEPMVLAVKPYLASEIDKAWYL